MSSSEVQLQPKSIGREFVRRYYTVLNHSPENLHCFYNDEATFIHDDIDPMEQKTISVVGKTAIRDVMEMRRLRYRHTCTIINGIDTVATINNGLVVQVFGEIAHNDEEMRPFSQSFVLMAVSSLKFYVLNEIFRFRDFLPDTKRAVSEAESAAESAKASQDINTTFMVEANDVMTDDDENDNNDVTPETNAETINELQTQHLKSILQESLSKDGGPPNYRKQIESAVTVAAVAPAPLKQISKETAKQLFQDKCIITVGSVINPNIKFDEEKPTESAPKPVVVLQSKPVTELKSKSVAKSQTKVSIETQTNPYLEPQSKVAPEPETATKSQTKPPVESQLKAKIDLPQKKSKKSPPKPVKEPKEKSSQDQNNNNDAIEHTKKAVDAVEAVEARPEVVKEVEKTPIATEAPEEKPKSYAELLKLAREKSRSTSSSSRSSSCDLRSTIKDKPLIIRNSLRRKNGKQSPMNRDHQSRSDSVLQVFIGNIMQSASEEDLRRMFGKFGAISRFRIHKNPDKDWLPYYAFVTYENIDAVRRCLAQRNSLYYPENAPNRLKLNVNGDESIVLFDEEKPKQNAVTAKETNGTNQQLKRQRDLKQFHKNFVISTKSNGEPITEKLPEKKLEKKNSKSHIPSEAVKSRPLDCDRIHSGRNHMQRVSGKA